MKKTSGILLIVAMAIAMVGCGQKEEVAPSTPQNVGGTTQKLGDPATGPAGTTPPTTTTTGQ